MASTVIIDLRQITRGLDIPLRQVQATVELLEEGNTVPFITRYRKDQTGGLDEEQIRQIQDRLAKLRLLAERKQTILRSIESQGRLTEKLTKQILAATTTKRLEDLYLPYKPKKQTLATNARNRGLEGLAQEILEANPLCADLYARAKDYANPDRQVPTPADALLGAGHIIAELFSEQAELRQRLREIMQRSGVIVTTRIAPEPKSNGEKAEKPLPEADVTATTVAASLQHSAEAVHSALTADASVATKVESVESAQTELPALDENQNLKSSPIQSLPLDQPVHVVDSTSAAEPPAHEAASAADTALPAPEAAPHEPAACLAVQAPTEAISAHDSVPALGSYPEPLEPPAALPAVPVADASADSLSAESLLVSLPATDESALLSASTTDYIGLPLTPAERKQLERQKAKQFQLAKREQKKKRLEEKRIKAFRDYFDYREEIKKIPPHRILAINRGERARVLRVKIETDLQAMVNAVEEFLVPPNHPHADYLRGCARDSLSRLILPSLERDVRRELTDRAEAHAVGVFAKNLRNLFLHPPVHNHRVLALDPGYKSGCKLAALDQFGNLLEQGVIFLVGKPERREQARHKIVELVKKHQLTVVAIGNGTACREAEKFIADLLGSDLKEQNIAYVIVNEAGASVYSTSRIGREELPNYDAVLRGAISIGRRLQDPLSELVKIDPANIGVGLYQHDVKAKHLRASLDEVVESCVNYVGVDVNTASPALLRYVSGLNQLTARRLFEYRGEHGPFSNREQLRQVPGFGEATFVQAAGFLKIAAGDNPLDATWIHPESYSVANRVLERLGCTPNDLIDKNSLASIADRVAQVDLEALAGELAVGALSLKDILAQLARPGRDPREDLPSPVFKHGVLKLEDLTPGMELTGTVLNVVDFGCFVDIGMHDSGLVHVSHLADRYVRDPHEVVTVGDVVKVWVLSIDKERRRVSLTMVQPGTERPKPPRHAHRPPQKAKTAGVKSDIAPQDGAITEESRTEASADQKEHEQNKFPRRDRGRQRQPHGRRPPHPEPQRPSAGRTDRGPDRPPRPRPHVQRAPKSRPKPVVPITDAMKEGKEPMRTFGDLMQFFQHKNKPPEETESTAAEPAQTIEEKPIPIVEAPSTNEPARAINNEIQMHVPVKQTESPGPEQTAQTEEQPPQNIESEPHSDNG
jgi:uncharacterized protein